MTGAHASASRLYRVKAQPANEGGYAVMLGKAVVFSDLHRSLASSMARDLNAAVGSGRVYRCGLPVQHECKVVASDNTRIWTPRMYAPEAMDFATELNRAAALRSNPGSARWFHGGDHRTPPMPRLTPRDYRRLRAHAMACIGAAAEDAGKSFRLSAGNVFAAPDGAGGADLWFPEDLRRSEVYYSISASTLKRRAAAK